MPDVLNPPASTKPAKRGFFTAENAAKYAALAHAARRQQAIAATNPEPVVIPQQIAPPADNFITRKLARVREQIERVEALLDDADEPQAVDRFCNALTRLYELERILSGRPLPGSRRPAQERAPRELSKV